jgi:NTP pyrophosphatase (non-canonical NTP hydrolase)
MTTLFPHVSINLEILAEECAEVIQIKSKIVRFGFDDQHPTYPTNRARLEEEIGHVFAMVEILIANGEITQSGIDAGKLHKLNKLKGWYPA